MQQSVKKLHEKEILQRSQQNLDDGRYIYGYKINSRAEVKNIVINVISYWAKRLIQKRRDLICIKLRFSGKNTYIEANARKSTHRLILEKMDLNLLKDIADL
jgi:hypothetical protein